MSIIRALLLLAVGRVNLDRNVACELCCFRTALEGVNFDRSSRYVRQMARPASLDLRSDSCNVTALL